MQNLGVVRRRNRRRATSSVSMAAAAMRVVQGALARQTYFRRALRYTAAHLDEKLLLKTLALLR